MKVEWMTPVPFSSGQISSSNVRPTVVDDSLIIFAYGDGFVCLNTNSGVIKWKTTLHITSGNYSQSWVATDMIVENGRLYTLAGYGTGTNMTSTASAVCISIADGSLIWRHDLALGDYFAWQWCKYSASSTAIYYATQTSHVVALSKTDGSVLWDSPNGAVNQPVQFGIYQLSPSYRNGVVYVGSGRWDSSLKANIGGISALDAQTGNVLWQKTVPLPNSSCGYYNPSLLLDTKVSTPPIPVSNGIIITAGFCDALMDTMGNIVWMRTPTSQGNLSVFNWQPFLNNNALLGFNNGNGTFYGFSIDVNNGNVGWNSRPEQATEISFPPFLDTSTGTLYQQSDGQELFGYNIVTGARTFLTPLTYYLDLNEDATRGPYYVQGNHIYLLTNLYIMCLGK